MLHRLLSEAMARKGMSYRMVQDATDWRVSKSALTYLLDGRSVFISKQSIEALAPALGLTEAKIRAAALETQRTRDELWSLAVQMDPESLADWLDAGRSLAGSRRSA